MIYTAAGEGKVIQIEIAHRDAARFERFVVSHSIGIRRS
jgi:hypothetical protein